MKARIIAGALALALVGSAALNLHLWREVRAHRAQAAKITAELLELVEGARAHHEQMEAIAAQQLSQAAAAQKLLAAIRENGVEIDALVADLERLRAENKALRARPPSVIVRGGGTP